MRSTRSRHPVSEDRGHGGDDRGGDERDHRDDARLRGAAAFEGEDEDRDARTPLRDDEERVGELDAPELRVREHRPDGGDRPGPAPSPHRRRMAHACNAVLGRDRATRVERLPAHMAEVSATLIGLFLVESSSTSRRASGGSTASGRRSSLPAGRYQDHADRPRDPPRALTRASSSSSSPGAGPVRRPLGVADRRERRHRAPHRGEHARDPLDRPPDQRGGHHAADARAARPPWALGGLHPDREDLTWAILPRSRPGSSASRRPSCPRSTSRGSSEETPPEAATTTSARVEGPGRLTEPPGGRIAAIRTRAEGAVERVATRGRGRTPGPWRRYLSSECFATWSIRSSGSWPYSDLSCFLSPGRGSFNGSCLGSRSVRSIRDSPFIRPVALETLVNVRPSRSCNSATLGTRHRSRGVHLAAGRAALGVLG